jgi:HSP20 family molecular chaperone IbpA
MSNAVCWERWGILQKKITFQAFRKQIKLPEPIEPERAEASFKSGILQITLPKVRRKVLIKVG